MPESTSERPGAAADRNVYRVHINGSIEDVWHEITRTDRPIRAFFNNRMHVGTLAPGSRIAMRSANGKWTGVVGEIVEFDPPHRFAHTFRFTDLDDPECIVTYELEEVDGGTRFTLRISDLAEGTKTAKRMRQGATMINNTLKSVIETGRPSLAIRMMHVMMKAMAPMSPRRCRSEHWPVEGERVAALDVTGGR